ncbi:hypothetical protein BS50DRAFT_537863 [Corynespora cassiicola Philippines]|uniref:Zn(2)-C6 fungal-type domain-containing protein n=1 Tax=Corynespora cassiicola Philippines TaxID=1448308 RepID=A0A2T2N0Z6_CORCC|nr:hypothetical protein BS50DRAFT_537863 [Corynespora cassiicola Philippines]
MDHNRQIRGFSPKRRSDLPGNVGSTFRVTTSNDFGSNSRRRGGLSAIACQVCRMRKVKCRVDVDRPDHGVHGAPSGPLKCQACKQANLQCCWDTVDRRKQRRRQTSDQTERQPLFEEPYTATIQDSIAQASREESCHTAPTAEPGQQHPESDPTAQSSSEILGDTRQIPAINFGPADIAGIDCAEHCDLSIARTQSLQADVEEIYTADDMEASYDYFDIQDFVVDLDALHNAGVVSDRIDNGVGYATMPVRRESKIMRLRFYRRFGPTAVLPGLLKLSVAVDPQTESLVGPSRSNSQKDDRSKRLQTPMRGLDFPASLRESPSEGWPYDQSSEWIYQMLDLFFEYFSGHFPFLNPRILKGHVHSKQASSFLINSIAALTMRFAPLSNSCGAVGSQSGDEWRKGTLFLKRAKEQALSLLGIPAPEVVAGLLILAWAEFGDNNEAGLWMFSGMAIRMAQDLGLHRSSKTESGLNAVFYDHAPRSPEGEDILDDEQSAVHQQKARLVMFWSVFIIDVSVSLLTGRVPTFRISEIEVPIPTADDMKVAQLDSQTSIFMEHIIFPEVVRFMIQYSRAVEHLNRNSTGAGATSNGSCTEAQLAKIKQSLINDYQSLDVGLLFNIGNYTQSSSIGQSGLFLMFHLYFYTFMILLFNRSLQCEKLNQRPSPEDIPDNTNHRMAIFLSCQKVVQALNIAELVDGKGYLTSPFTNISLFVTASAFLDDLTNNPFPLVSDIEFNYLCQKLREQGCYFKGICTTLAALQRRKRSSATSRDAGDQFCSDEDPSQVDFVVEIGDDGIVNRYTIPR